MVLSPHRSFLASCFILLAVLAVPMQHHAQTALPGTNQAAAGGPVQLTAEDYVRSNQLRPNLLKDKLKNGFVVPHWIGQHDEFWYKRSTAKGHEFILANAASGQVHPAFDHAALAQAFAKAAGTETSADTLPFEDITFNNDRSSIRVRVQDKDYDCQIQPPVECSDGKPVFPKPAVEISFFSPTAKSDAADPNEGVLISPDTKWGVFTL